jgi:hypothetical protein
MGFISSDGSEHDSSYDQKHHESNVYGRNDDGGDLGLAKEIMNAPANFLKGIADKAANDRAKAEAERDHRKNTARTANTLVDFYCAGNWNSLISFFNENEEKFDHAYTHYKANALAAIAFAKKGKCKDAYRAYIDYLNLSEPGGEDDHEDVVKHFSENTKKVFSEGNLQTLAEEAVKQAYSKEIGHQVSENEFKLFKISYYEEEIRRTEGSNSNAINMWKNLSGKELTKEELTRIANGNGKMVKHIMLNIKLDNSKATVAGKIGCFLALAAIVVIAVVIAALIL